MISNKVLYIKELAFNLPDDFTGDIADALEILVADKRKSINAESEQTDEVVTNSKAVNWLWEHPDKKCYMEKCICEYNQETKQWEYR